MTTTDNIAHVESYKGHTIVIEYDTDAQNPRHEYNHAATMACFHSRYTLGDKGHGFSDGEELGYFLGAIRPGPTPRKPRPVSDDSPFTVDELTNWRRLARDYTAYRLTRGRKGLFDQLTEAEHNPALRLALRQRIQTVLYNMEREAWQQIIDQRQYYGYEPFDGEWLPIFLYDHSGLAMSTGSFSDPWDSGCVGAIYMDREDIIREYGTPGGKLTKAMRERARKLMEAEAEEYDQYLTGQVYGYRIVEGSDDDEKNYDPISDEWTPFDVDTAEEVDSCWGMYGLAYCIAEAKSVVDNLPAVSPPQQQTTTPTQCNQSNP